MNNERYHNEYVFRTEYIVIDENDLEEAYFYSFKEARNYIKEEIKAGRDECFGLIKVRSMSMLTGWGGAELVRTTVLKRFF